jgi:hypothetical protein
MIEKWNKLYKYFWGFLLGILFEYSLRIAISPFAIIIILLILLIIVFDIKEC